MKRILSLLVFGTGLVICLSLTLLPPRSANADPPPPTATRAPISDIKSLIQQHHTSPPTQPQLEGEVLEECPLAPGHGTISPEPTLLQSGPLASTTLYSTGDACILQGYSTLNAGDTVDMWAGYDTYYNARIVSSLVKFDLSTIPSGSTINSATFKARLVISFDKEGDSRTITVYRITGPWSEGSVTWNNKPGYSGSYYSVPIVHSAWGWYEWNVKDLVQEWVNSTYNNYGLMLRGDPEQTVGWRGFSTREGSYSPRLIVDFTPPTVTPTPTETPPTTPTATCTPTETPVPPPCHSGSVVFQSNRDGNWEIYKMRDDGYSQENHTENPADDISPAWSSDGEEIVFASSRDGNWEVYKMRHDGYHQENLTENPADDIFPAWSPDGQEIVFASNRDGNWEIYKMRNDGYLQKNLTRHPGDDTSPAWSPDGEEIVFASNRDGNWEVYKMRANGYNQENLTDNEADDTFPAWSPDGQEIVFASNRDGNWEVYKMRGGGYNQENLTDNEADDMCPAWWPYCESIFFQTNRDGNWEVYKMRDDGYLQENLTDNEADDLISAPEPEPPPPPVTATPTSTATPTATPTGTVAPTPTATPTQDGSGPNLSISSYIPAYVGQTVSVPINFTSNSHGIASTVFSVDFDQTCLAFDPTDSDQDGIPDAITFNLAGAFNASVTFDGNDTDGELDFFIADLFPPLASLPDGAFAAIAFMATCRPDPGTSIITPVGFSDDPSASFGNTDGRSVPGTTSDGSVEIVSGTPGDCNGDGAVDAGDISALILEIFDGDGNNPADTPGGTFPGDPVGCDANCDGVVDAGDISCVVLLIFGGSGACGGEGSPASVTGPSLPFGPAALSDGPTLAIPDQVPVSPGGMVILPVNFTANGHSISSVVFSVDYDQTWLTFDPTDNDEDGIPDAVTFTLPGALNASVTFDGNDTDGELDFFIADLFPPLASLSDGAIVYMTLNVGSPPSAMEAAVNFSSDPAASFGNTSGQSIPGATDDGSVLIVPTGTPTHTPTPTPTATQTPTPTSTPLSGSTIYLPVITKLWPPVPDIPVLHSTSNPDGDGNYTVSWSTAARATSYTLEEDDDSTFPSPATRYSGSGTSWAASGKGTGTYYYRVRASNSWGDSGWSNVQSVSVQLGKFYSVADTTVLQGYPNENFGSTTDLWMGYDHCLGGKIARSLVQFDLSSIPARASISRATLRLYLMNSCDIGERTHSVTVYRAKASWSESSVIWNTRPDYAEAYGSTSIPSRTWGWYSFDVTGLVRGWVNGSFADHGMMIRGPESSGDDSAQLGFYTRNKYGRTYDPYLSIEYAGTVTFEETVPAMEAPPDLTECGPTIKDMLSTSPGASDSGMFEAIEDMGCSPD